MCLWLNVLVTKSSGKPFQGRLKAHTGVIGRCQQTFGPVVNLILSPVVNHILSPVVRILKCQPPNLFLMLSTESLPQTSPAVIVGAVIGAIIGVIIIAVVAYLLIRVMRSTRDYEG